MDSSVPAQALQEMKAYYRERAREYDEWFYRQGRYDRGREVNERWFAEIQEVSSELDALDLTGDVLELAAGTGIWTEQLVRKAATLTSVDASSEVIEINRAKVSSDRVLYVQADLFSWQPERVYDAVFFGFWISHIPLERLNAFLRSVANMLRPGGKVFFLDGRREPTSTAGNHQLPEVGNQLMTRLLNDGRAFTIVKNYYDPVDLADRCREAGLEMTIAETATYFLYGSGIRR
jgi:2-polyprenyl-3-methyl-5-hydroxy-6-metoxy-1,4-benzoquinol methylase